MKCARCSAAVFGPLVQGGVSVRKIADRARRAVAESEDSRARAAVEVLANTAELLAAEAAMRGLSDGTP